MDCYKRKSFEDLIHYAYDKYSEPDKNWKKPHYDKRCNEIYTVDVAMAKCIDNPFLDFTDILSDYLLEICMLYDRTDNKKLKNNFAQSINVLEDLIDYSK